MLLQSAVAVPFYPAWVSTLLKDLQTLVQLIAVLVAGLWAYMKFVKGRLFYPRLEVSATGVAFLREAHTTLSATLRIKNVGLSRVDIRQRGTALRVYVASELEPDPIVTPDWQRLATFPVFENHGWIEPGETIDENRLFIIAELSERDYQLELNIGSGALVWIATSILTASAARTIEQLVPAARSSEQSMPPKDWTEHFKGPKLNEQELPSHDPGTTTAATANARDPAN